MGHLPAGVIGSASTVSTSRSGKTNPAEARASDRCPLLYPPSMTLTTCVRENSQISCNERKILEAPPGPAPGPHPPDPHRGAPDPHPPAPRGARQTPPRRPVVRQDPANPARPGSVACHPPPAPSRQTTASAAGPARADYRQPGLGDLLPRREGGGFAQAPPHAHRLVAITRACAGFSGNERILDSPAGPQPVPHPPDPHPPDPPPDPRPPRANPRPPAGPSGLPPTRTRGRSASFAKCGRSASCRQVWTFSASATVRWSSSCATEASNCATPASSPSVDARIIAKCGRPHHRQV